MRHRKRGRKLGRNTAHRKALRRNLARNLILSGAGRVITTLEKAKEADRFVHRLVTLARNAGTAPGEDVHPRRRAMTLLPDKEAVKKLFGEIAPAMKDRPGGYTRILKLGGRVGKYRARRLGDGARRVIWEWTDRPGLEEEETPKKKAKKGVLARLKGGKKKASGDGESEAPAKKKRTRKKAAAT